MGGFLDDFQDGSLSFRDLDSLFLVDKIFISHDVTYWSGSADMPVLASGPEKRSSTTVAAKYRGVMCMAGLSRMVPPRHALASRWESTAPGFGMGLKLAISILSFIY
jgi:hypothetical protein